MKTFFTPKKSSNNIRLRQCVVLNLSLLLFIFIVIVVSRNPDDKYFRYGPNNDLFVMSIRVDTWKKYWLLQVCICIIEVVNMIIGELAMPILNFNIYNPDKKVIDEFTKNELQLLGNTMWCINSLIKTLTVLVSISQMDIAILRVFYSEATSIYSIRVLLNEKQFKTNETLNDPDEALELV